MGPIWERGVKWSLNNIHDRKRNEETSSVNDYEWKITELEHLRHQLVIKLIIRAGSHWSNQGIQHPAGSEQTLSITTWPLCLCDRQRGIYMGSFILSGDSWCFNGHSWCSKSLHLESNALKSASFFLSLVPIFQRICSAAFDATSTSLRQKSDKSHPFAVSRWMKSVEQQLCCRCWMRRR